MTAGGTHGDRAHRVIAVAALALGTAILLLALLAAGLVASLVSIVGSTGVVSQDFGDLQSGPDDVAVIADDVRADVVPTGIPSVVEAALGAFGAGPSQLVRRYGEFFLIGSSATSTQGFLGTGAAPDVDEYLFGHPYAVAVLDSGRWQLRAVPGKGQPGPPDTAVAWSAQATGSPAELPATHLSGQTLVVMNADGSAGVTQSLRLEYRAPHARAAITGAAALAVLCAGLGLALVLIGMSVLVPKDPARPTNEAQAVLGDGP